MIFSKQKWMLSAMGATRFIPVIPKSHTTNLVMAGVFLGFCLLFGTIRSPQAQDQNASLLARMGLNNLIEGSHSAAHATLEAAVSEGSGGSAALLAAARIVGLGAKADHREALKWAERGAKEHQDPVSARIAGWLHLRGVNQRRSPDRALHFLSQAAKAEDPPSMYYLGRLLEHGAPGVAADLPTAVSWYERGAAVGMPFAQWRLGELLVSGQGGQRNPSRGMKLLENAASQGVIPAMASVGRHYFNGIGVIQNFRKAFEYYLTAAQLGNIHAQNMIGYMLINRIGTADFLDSEEFQNAEKADELARKMFLRAGLQKSAEALFNLGIAYLGEDDIRAHAFFNLAASLGLGTAQERRDDAGDRLSRSQLQTAQQLASEWHFEQPMNEMRVQGSGSGFFVSASGAVVTNHHVAKGCDAIAVRIGDKQLQVDVIAANKAKDLALLRPHFREGDQFDFRIARLGAELDFVLGERVSVFGWPLSLNYELSADGVFTAGTLSALVGPQSDDSMIQISAPIQPGNSGGPVLGETGSVIGVVRSRFQGEAFQNVNFAVKTPVLIRWLQRFGHEFYTIDTSTQKSLRTRELAQIARKSSVQVLCYGFRPSRLGLVASSG